MRSRGTHHGKLVSGGSKSAGIAHHIASLVALAAAHAGRLLLPGCKTLKPGRVVLAHMSLLFNAGANPCGDSATAATPVVEKPSEAAAARGGGLLRRSLEAWAI